MSSGPIRSDLYSVYENDPRILFNVFHLQSTRVLAELHPDTLGEIIELSAKSLRTLAMIFQRGIDEGVFIEHKPIAMADNVWAVFTGLVLWEENKRLFDPKKDFLKPTLSLALEIIARGIKKA